MNDKDKRIERLEAALRTVDRHMSGNDNYEGIWVNYPDKPEQSPASIVREALDGEGSGEQPCVEKSHALERASRIATDTPTDDAVGGDKSWMPEHGYDSFPDYTPRHGGDFVGTGGPLPGEPGNPNPSFAQMETDGRRDALEAFKRISRKAGEAALFLSGAEPGGAIERQLNEDRETVRRAITNPAVPEATKLHRRAQKAEGVIEQINNARHDFQRPADGGAENTVAMACLGREVCKILSRSAQHSEPGQGECGWSLDDEGCYHTDCGKEFEMVDFLTLEETSMKYCSNCGRRIRDDGAPAPDADERE